MKVLLINGSPHKTGNTFAALTEIAQTLGNEGVESEIAWIGNRPVRGCIACGVCKAKGEGKCVFDDDVCNSLSSKFAESDGFVFASPVYYGQPNGALLSIMQRAFYSNGAQLQNKPAAVLTICRRGGATAAFDRLNKYFTMMNMPLVSSQYWNMVYGQTPGQASQDDEGLQTMRTLGRNMAWLLKKLSTGDGSTPKKEQRVWTNFIR